MNGIKRIGNHNNAWTKTDQTSKDLRLPIRSEIKGANNWISIFAKLGKLDKYPICCVVACIVNAYGVIKLAVNPKDAIAAEPSRVEFLRLFRVCSLVIPDGASRCL
jgi:hypothetical protein